MDTDDENFEVESLQEDFEQMQADDGYNIDLIKAKYLRLRAELYELKSAKINGRFLPLSIDAILPQKYLDDDIKELEDLDGYMTLKANELKGQISKIDELLHKEQHISNIVQEEIQRISNLEDVEENETGSKARLEYKKLKKLVKLHRSQLSEFLQLYFSRPDENDVALYQNGQDIFETSENSEFLLLSEILDMVIARFLKNPANQWVEIGSNMWKPHIELLLHCRIICRHKENSNWIKLEQFD